MEAFGIVLIVAVVVQFLVEQIKKPLPEKVRSWAVPLLALAVGLMICILGRIDVLAAAGVVLSPVWVSYILTGIAVSGGSTAVNELIKALMAVRTEK